MQTKHEFNGDIWLGFERLTVVPIQTKMVKDTMLSKEERQWVKVRLLHEQPPALRSAQLTLLIL